MTTTRVFRSTDTNAPPLSGVAGSLIDLLDACLVNGYGSVFASGTLTSSGVIPTAGDTITIGTKTYTWRAALTVGVANEVLIGASAATALSNLQAAVNLTGTSGTTYTAVTLGNADVWASAVTATVLTLKARRGGTGGNALALTTTAATITPSGATLAGGSGSDTTVAAGWTKPFVGNPGQAVYRPGSGVQHYFHVDDALPNATAQAKEGQHRGSELATGFQAGTGASGYFPSTVQFAIGAGLVIRKSGTIDTTARTWIAAADERACYLFVLTGDVASTYFAAALGEFYSIYSGTDLYRSFVIGRIVANSGLSGQERLAEVNSAMTTVQGHFAPRSYTAVGGSLALGKFGDWARSQMGANSSSTLSSAGMTTVNGPDGKLHISPLHVGDTNFVRGRYRGLYQVCANQSMFADGDTIVGAGPYAGRTFTVIKQMQSSQGTAGAVLLDITGPWETN